MLRSHLMILPGSRDAIGCNSRTDALVMLGSITSFVNCRQTFSYGIVEGLARDTREDGTVPPILRTLCDANECKPFA